MLSVCSMQMHDRKDIRLFYGTKNTDTTAYSDLDDSWKAAGVQTIHVYSDDNKGYVQDVFSKVCLHLSLVMLVAFSHPCTKQYLLATFTCNRC